MEGKAIQAESRSPAQQKAPFPFTLEPTERLDEHVQSGPSCLCPARKDSVSLAGTRAERSSMQRLSRCEGGSYATTATIRPLTASHDEEVDRLQGRSQLQKLLKG